MHYIKYIEFYLTNVCNLNCTNCNRFNNYAFTGHERWADYKELYTKWSKILQIGKIGFLGGEPMLNPDFLDWLHGISALWPKSDIVLHTNGTQLHKWDNLYQELIKYADRIIIKVNVHNQNEYQTMIKEVEDFLVAPVSKEYNLSQANKEWPRFYNSIRAETWPECNKVEDIVNLPDFIREELTADFGLDVFIAENCELILTDANGVDIRILKAWVFAESAVVYNPTSHSLSLLDSDPNLAIDACFSKFCHHFSKGKMYKCGVVGILPDFVKQFPVDMTEKQKQLIESYRGAHPDDRYDDLADFINGLSLGSVIDQCSLCPSNANRTTIASSNKKIKIARKSKVSP